MSSEAADLGPYRFEEGFLARLVRQVEQERADHAQWLDGVRARLAAGLEAAAQGYAFDWASGRKLVQWLTPAQLWRADMKQYADDWEKRHRASPITPEPEFEDGLRHSFGPARVGRQTGPASYDTEFDPCACGTTWEEHLCAAKKRVTGSIGILEAALDAEGITGALRQRIVYRFLYGVPNPFEGHWPALGPCDPLPKAERAAHRCNERCVCPADGRPMFYAPSQGLHACQDSGCAYARPGGRRLRPTLADLWPGDYPDVPPYTPMTGRSLRVVDDA